MTSVTELIQKHEACRLTTYRDSRGFLTIGWGHCIDDRVQGCHDLDPSLYMAGSITQATADQLLSDDIATATLPLVLHCTPWFQALGQVRQAVLVDMSYNMGFGTLQTFQTFLGMVSAGNYQSAADDMLRTLWARQVGIRATEDSAMMASGTWPA